MALLFVLIGAFLVSWANLCLQKNLQHQRSANGYYTLYFLSALVSAFFFFPHFSMQHFSFVMSLIGIVDGILLFSMMLLIARALQLGPFGLTFAFQNSACILPTLILFFLFGNAFGFHLTQFTLTGFACIIFGLFLSSRTTRAAPSLSSKWLILAIVIFLLQGSQLFIFQWRCLLFTHTAHSHILIPWNCLAEHDVWFMAGLFLVPAVLQTFLFGFSEKRWFTSREAVLGITAGILNGGATFFLMLGTKTALGQEKIILFPLFAVSVIFLCSLYGWKWQREKISWIGLLLCVLGVLIGSL